MLDQEMAELENWRISVKDNLIYILNLGTYGSLLYIGLKVWSDFS